MSRSLAFQYSQGKHVFEFPKMLIRITLFIFASLEQLQWGHSIPASPHHFEYRQPDGSVANIRILGDEKLNYEVDSEGYTVFRDEAGWQVYAQRNDDSGLLESSGLRVGKDDPKESGLVKGIIPDMNSLYEFNNHHRILGDGGNCDHGDCARNLEISERYGRKLHNLVLLLRFADHEDRELPSRSSYEKLMNSVGGDSTYAPTGSVRDVYLESSNGQFEIESTVYGWVDLSNEEKFYASGKAGLTPKFLDAIHEALDRLENDGLIDFQKFDQDRDGVIDAITLIHSGFGAEWGGLDCDGSAKDDRIWSHQRPEIKRKWCSSKGICVQRYIVSSGLWGSCSVSISRIGVFAHELGHFLGLQDMYDGKDGGFGIGSYGLMGNCWGFDGSQLHPPILDPWSRIKLGWITPQTVFMSGTYSLAASISTGEVYKIIEGFPEGEYLLIENRQPMGFETPMPQGGLAIWHIDELADNINEGYPGQAGWPSNGNHYMIALVQADGIYQLEKGLGHGDKGDVWHARGNDHLGPSKDLLKGPFPNTDSYQGGNITRTGVEIRDISESGARMSFRLFLPSSKPTKTDSPTASPLNLTVSSTRAEWSNIPSSLPSAAPSDQDTDIPSSFDETQTSTQAVYDEKAKGGISQVLKLILIILPPVVAVWVALATCLIFCRTGKSSQNKKLPFALQDTSRKVDVEGGSLSSSAETEPSRIDGDLASLPITECPSRDSFTLATSSNDDSTFFSEDINKNQYWSSWLRRGRGRNETYQAQESHSAIPVLPQEERS